MRRMVLAEQLDPPRWVVPLRHRFLRHGGAQGVGLAQVAAQAGVDEAGLGLGRLAALGGFDRLVHQHMGLIARRLAAGQGQRAAQQRIGCRRRRAACELLAQGLGLAQLAQHGKAQRLHTRAQARHHLGQQARGGLPTQHRLDQLRGRLQLLPQRHLGLRIVHGFINEKRLTP